MMVPPKPDFYPWKLADDAKAYRTVFALPSKNSDLQLVDELCEHAKRGDAEKVKALLKQGVDIEATTDSTGSTPLHLAAAGGHLDVVKLLLEHGADINAMDRGRSTPLIAALRNKHRELADFLMSKGAQR